MKKNTLTVRIEKPVQEVFLFTIDPQKTPLWIEGMQKEKASEWPPKVGTVYKNTWDGTSWDEYYVSEITDQEVFELTERNGPYRVRYTYRSITDNQSEIEYFEWMEEGELADPFTEKAMFRLKQIIEEQ